MWKKILLLISLGWICNVWAGPYDPIASMAWVGETIPGQNTATLQLNLTTIKAVELMSVSSPVAESVEIHSLTKYKGKLQLQIVKTLGLPEHQTISFGSRNLFLMMTGIKQPLAIGDTIPVTLQFAFKDNTSKSISTTAVVKKMELSYKHYGTDEVYDHR